jgi:hypothetical protein
MPEQQVPFLYALKMSSRLLIWGFIYPEQVKLQTSAFSAPESSVVVRLRF